MAHSLLFTLSFEGFTLSFEGFTLSPEGFTLSIEGRLVYSACPDLRGEPRRDRALRFAFVGAQHCCAPCPRDRCVLAPCPFWSAACPESFEGRLAAAFTTAISANNL